MDNIKDKIQKHKFNNLRPFVELNIKVSMIWIFITFYNF